MSKKEAIAQEIDELFKHLKKVEAMAYANPRSGLILQTYEDDGHERSLLTTEFLPGGLVSFITAYLLNGLKRLSELREQEKALDKAVTREFPCEVCDEGEYQQTGGGGPNGQMTYTCTECGDQRTFP